MGFENLGSFNRAVASFSRDRVPARAQQLQRVVALDALQEVVLRTPVDTGRARANWQVAIGQGSTSPIEATDPQGRNTIGREFGKISGAPPFSLIQIQNNVAYIGVLENGEFDPPNPGPTKAFKRRKVSAGTTLVAGGFSTQAPQGMVGVTVHRLIQKYGGRGGVIGAGG